MKKLFNQCNFFVEKPVIINVKSLKIGFIGQGWIGKSYADDFEERGFKVIRYSLEEKYIKNKREIKNCDVVFVAVPTPTTKKGFDISYVEDALKCVGKNKIAVVKSTILPGTTDKLQKKFKSITVMHSPEFLREITAKMDAKFPKRNIIGITKLDRKNKDLAKKVLKVLPASPYSKIMKASEAELVKYIGNCFLYEKVVFFNQMYDLSHTLKLDFENIRDAVVNDERIGSSHTQVAHASGHDLKNVGRGAGGHCFIKDYEALLVFYKKALPKDKYGISKMQTMMDKNYSLLVKSKKDIDLLTSVIGDIRKYR